MSLNFLKMKHHIAIKKNLHASLWYERILESLTRIFKFGYHPVDQLITRPLSGKGNLKTICVHLVTMLRSNFARHFSTLKGTQFVK